MIHCQFQASFSENKEYELQRLVPTEDFALRHWMITTFHMINYAPQHKSKVSLWNAINSHVHDRIVQAQVGEIHLQTEKFRYKVEI